MYKLGHHAYTLPSSYLSPLSALLTLTALLFPLTALISIIFLSYYLTSKFAYSPSSLGRGRSNIRSAFRMTSTLYTTSALPETHMEFDTGPSIELRPLTLLDDTTNSSLRAETHSSATLREQWMHSLKEWGWEIAACLCSLTGFCGMVGLLVAFDGKSQPAWPYGVTLNSAVSLLSTVTKSPLLIPAGACISQSM
jgi:hypothetical protein